MPLVFDSPIKVIQDVSVLEVETVEKAKVKKLLSHFDIELTEDKSKCKYYPLDDFSKDEDELPRRVCNVASSHWFTLLYHIEKALENHPQVIDLVDDIKIGKVYTTSANRFCTSYGKDDVLPYLFIYKTDEGLELMSEINFGIEIY